MGWRSYGRLLDTKPAKRPGRELGQGDFNRGPTLPNWIERAVWIFLALGLAGSICLCAAVPYLESRARRQGAARVQPVRDVRTVTPSVYGLRFGADAQPNPPILPVPGVTAPLPLEQPRGRVEVRGYYRKDGTYVRPHTRSR